MKISILTDNKTSWFIPFGNKLASSLSNLGHDCVYVFSKMEIPEGDICFLLSCSSLIKDEILKRNRNNIVVHASDLPAGKGFSPLQWQILQGNNEIVLTLFEAVSEVDAGPYYFKKKIDFKGDELYDDLRSKLGEIVIDMCIEFVEEYDSIHAKLQFGKETFFRKRSVEDDKIDVNKTIAEQFNLFRIADNENHPLWFYYKNRKFYLKIYKEKETNEFNSVLYRFNDFTLNNYKKLLKIAQENYTFSFYLEKHGYPKNTIILRHDVEFSVPIALEMAKIEHDLGIRATYFIQLHGDFYNALESKTFKQIREIESLGHQLALHFDAHFWEITREDQLDSCLKKDKETFEKYFYTEPKVFSFHNNNAFTLSCTKDMYGGMINVYSVKYTKEFGYCADSTGFWRYEVLEDRLNEAKDQVLQVLIHDGMWQNEVLPPRRRVYKVIDDHAAFMKKSYDETLIKFGAKNIDWDNIL